MLTLRIAALGAALIAAQPVTTWAQERTATLTVPGSALVFDGPGLQPPDTEGHFAVGIRLPQPSIKATNCETANLIIGLGTLNKPEDQLTDADRKIIAGNRSYYDRLVAASGHGDPVAIPLRNRSAYLAVNNGVISAPYCTLSINESKVP